jgi:hypothetical protein
MPRSNIGTPLIAEKKRAPVLPKHAGVEIGRILVIPVGLGPPLLPIRVPENGPPFVGAEG